MEQAPGNDVVEPPRGEAIEDLVGGRVFAWVGGVAVLLGIAFLLAIAVSNGWIGEGARTVLAALVCGGLVGAGVWLHERRGRTDAAVAALACGIAGLFVTITVAAQSYELIPIGLATSLAVAVGAMATALAVRWESRGIAGLGILGGLCAPLLAGAGFDGGTVLIMFVALAAAAGVLLRQGWGWLALAAFGVSAPQWIAYLFGGASPGTAILALVAFGALGVVVAIGYDVRAQTERVRTQSAFLLALNAIVVAGAGWLALASMGEPTLGKLCLAGMSLAYATVGIAGPRLAGVSRDLGLLGLTLSVLIANVAFVLAAEGPALSIGWTITSIAFAVLLRRTRPGTDAERLAAGGLGGHVALALMGALAVDDPVPVLAGDAPLTLAFGATIASIAAGCLVSARLAGERGPAWRAALDAVGLAAVALLTALALDGSALVVAWVAEVAVLTAIAHRRRDEIAGWGALGFLALACLHVVQLDAPVELVAGTAGLASTLLPVVAVGAVALAAARVLPGLLSPSDPLPIGLLLDGVGIGGMAYLAALALDGELVVAAWAVQVVVLAWASRRLGDVVLGGGAVALLALAVTHVLVLEAPPLSLITGLSEPLSALGALAATAGAAALAARALRCLHPHARPGLLGVAALTVLYVASALVVTPFESGDAVESAVLSAHQQGQMVLSVFWALVGVVAVAIGLRRDVHGLRVAALALLGVAAVKVFLFDLASLTSVYRAVSFIGLGLLLMLGAFVWQRLRPRQPRDLRETPAGLR